MVETHRNLIVMDADTGDVLDQMPVYCPKKTKSFFTDGFFFMSLNAAIMLANSNLDGVTIKVLLRLIGTMEMENVIAVNQTELAEEMGILKSQFSRSVKILVEQGVLVENPRKSGRFKTYKLNPKYAWRGSNKDHAAAIEKHEDTINESTQTSNVIETDAVTVTTTVTTTVQAKKPPLNNQN